MKWQEGLTSVHALLYIEYTLITLWNAHDDDDDDVDDDNDNDDDDDDDDVDDDDDAGGFSQNFGVEVLGIDLSANMVDIAVERAAAEKMTSVSVIFCIIFYWLKINKI